MHKKLLSRAFLVAGLLTTPMLQAATFGGVDITPSAYEITLKTVEFRQAGGGWVTFIDGTYTFDIASTTAGAAVGAFATGSSLPNGTYDSMRITLSRTFNMTFATANAGAGQACRTNTGNGTGPYGGLTNAGSGTVGAVGATLQAVPIPTGGTVTTALSGAGFTEVGGAGGDIQFSTPVAFTIDENSTPPAMRIDFDVTNRAEAATTGAGTCSVFPQVPGVAITIR